MDKATQKQQLREDMRKTRARLTQKQKSEAESRIAALARLSPQIQNAQRIVSYSPFKGEISPAKITKHLAERARQIYFPKIVNFRTRRMQFYQSTQPTIVNKYGISEPSARSSPYPANSTNVILMPLVAFDRSGTRIGMGAGYYDRALMALSHQSSTKPFLIGLAHHFQEVKSLKPAPWDVPLDAILTDHEFITI